MAKDTRQASLHLGKKSKYSKIYDPSLLVRVDRRVNREGVGYKYKSESELPFIGYDVWNAYEISFLLFNGLPMSFIAKIVYSSQNEYIVESKSLKLYLNSFNGTKFEDEGEVKDIIQEDLTALLETPVEVEFFNQKWEVEEYFSDYITLESLEGDTYNEEFSVYQEDRSLLKCDVVKSNKVQKFHSALLKSNCKITSQPDWGDVYIYIKGKKILDKMGLLKYIISFRDENHFHEEICEAIYYSLWTILKPEELMVCCKYTRRGGISISPIRANKESLLVKDLIDVYEYYVRDLRE